MRRSMAIVALVGAMLGTSHLAAAQAPAAGQQSAVSVAGNQSPVSAVAAGRPSVPPAGRFTSRLVFVPPVPESRGGGRVPFGRSIQPGIVGFLPFRHYAVMEPGTAVMVRLPPAEGGPTGGLQMDVDPRGAQVYVDGEYAGVVSDFSGYYHHLEAVAGSHVIEFLAPGYEPLIAELTVSPAHTTTYRAAMTRAEGR
jgi:hypothetical protein